MNLSRLTRMSVGLRFALLSCALVALIFAVFAFSLTQAAGALIGHEVRERIAEKDQSIAAMINLFDHALSGEADRSTTLFASFLPPDYTLDPAHTIDIEGKPTPTLMAGGRVLNLDFTIPDQFLERTGAIATVFARSGDDFVRVTTSLKKQDGSRAIGTLLDRKGPAYAPVLAGQNYIGLAQLFGKQYITEYRPVRDAGGQVVGALFVGLDVDAQMAAIKADIGKLQLRRSGYYFVMDASSGPGRGHLLVHPGAAGQQPDTSSGPYARILAQGTGAFDFSSADASLGETAPTTKVVSFLSVPAWHWIVGGVVPRDEILADVAATRNRFLSIGFALVVGFAVLSAWFARRVVSRPLDAAASAASRLAGGDLSVRLDRSSTGDADTDEIGRLAHAIDGIGVGLARIVTQVRSTSAEMNDGTEQIAKKSGEISMRVADQAANLEETAASVEQITATMHSNAEHTARANRVAEDTAQAAAAGGAAVDRVYATMTEISRASQKIAEITSVIEGIAFQTNILALNAAVEAARAGTHGRGFAVVASEVRALAQRSADAVKEIDQLIAESSATVETGYRIAGEASTTMQDIVSHVGDVRAIIGEIANAAREQSAGIEQINLAVMQIGQATQQNAVLVNDAEHTTAELRERAAHLAQLVSVFKLGGGAERA